MINLTQKTSKNFIRMADDEGHEGVNKYLRIEVTGGGCAGYEYKLTFDSPEKKDLLFETLGVKICVDRKSHLLLDGLLIDWTNDLSAPGPRFENPRATSTCGCSTSFNIKQDSTLQENKPAWLQ